jgi:hypothetical protein
MNVKSQCNHCSGRIEFNASDLGQGETRTIECPHCHLETTIFVPHKPDAAGENPVWFGSEESLVEMRFGSGSWLRIKSLRLYRESHVHYLITQKSQVTELIEAAFGGLPTITSPDWVVAFGALVRAMESRLSPETFERAVKLMDEIAAQEASLLERGVSFPVGQIKSIDQPLPNLWRVAAGSTVYVHPPSDFISVSDTDGVTYCIRWSAVEHYRYAATYP